VKYDIGYAIDCCNVELTFSTEEQAKLALKIIPFAVVSGHKDHPTTICAMGVSRNEVERLHSFVERALDIDQSCQFEVGGRVEWLSEARIAVSTALLMRLGDLPDRQAGTRSGTTNELNALTTGYSRAIRGWKFLVPAASWEGFYNDLMDDIEDAVEANKSKWSMRWLIVWNFAPFVGKRFADAAMWIVKFLSLAS